MTALDTNRKEQLDIVEQSVRDFAEAKNPSPTYGMG